jgi:serine phosphatase RsbU (regulator of sigma subunit)
MTGTLALGALCTLANEGLGPAAVLTRLNRQLSGAHDGGFITCLCARLTDEGEVAFANAGHLSPYRNGEELEFTADLPLGISPGETYRERTFQLEPGDKLTLLSDGVLEARDVHGMLFGFDRTRAISSQTAGSIAQTARNYGQEDDITVLTVARAEVYRGDIEQAGTSVVMGR